MSPRQAWGADVGLRPPALVPALWKVCRGLRRGPAWTCGRRSEVLLPRSVLTARGGSPSGPGPHCRLLARAGGGRHGDVFSEDTDSRRPGDRLPGPTSPQTCPQRALAVAAAVARGGRGRWTAGTEPRRAVETAAAAAGPSPGEAGPVPGGFCPRGHEYIWSHTLIRYLARAMPAAAGWSATASGTAPPPGPQRSLLLRDTSRPGL